MKSLASQRRILIFTFLFIPIILLIIFVIYPALDLVRLSFLNWDGFAQEKTFAGLDNYKNLFFRSPDAWLSLKNNASYLIINLTFVFVELIIAMMITGKIKGGKFFQTIVFMPYIINGVAVGYAFSLLLSPVNGGLNEIMKAIGMGGLIQNWLSNERIVNYTLIAVGLWRYMGFNIILFISAMNSVPQDIIEAATVDGANSIQKFRHIVVPNISKTLEIVIFMTISGALSAFDLPFIMTSGGPNHASSTFILYAIDMAFKYRDFGAAAAMAVVVIIMVLVLVWLPQRLLQTVRGGEEQ